MSEQRLGRILLRPLCLLQSTKLRLSGPALISQTLGDKPYVLPEDRRWFRILSVAECVPSSVACLHFNVIGKFKLLLMAALGCARHFSGSQKSAGCAPSLIIAGQTDRRGAAW